MTVPFVPCDKTAQVTMKYISNDQPCVNVWHFIGTAEWDSTSLGQLCTYMDTWEHAHALAVRSVNCQYTGCYAVDLSTQNGPYAQITNVGDGGEVGAQLPNSITLAFKLATALRGKSFRGRTYWIGLVEPMLTPDGQQVLATTVTGITNVLQLIRTGAIPNSGQLVVRSIRHNGAYRAAGVMTPVTAIGAVDIYVDNQRRRLPAHNIHR